MSRAASAEALDALPVDTLVRTDGQVYERITPSAHRPTETWRCLHELDREWGYATYTANEVVMASYPFTTIEVLFRADAPVPADEVETLRRRLDAVVAICQRPRQGSRPGVHIDYDEVLAAATGRDEEPL